MSNQGVGVCNVLTFEKLKVEIYVEAAERFWKEFDRKSWKVMKRNGSFHKETNIPKDS